MTVTELIAEINYAHKGNNRAPAEGTAKWDRTLSIANRKLREWARDATTNWASLFEERSIGTFSTTQTFDLDDDVNKLSDFVYLENSDDARRTFSVVEPHRRAEFNEAVYISGNPKVLTFISPIAATDQWIGSDVIVPLYRLPDALSGASDDVIIDSPEWLIYATAAELARNDPAKDDQFGNLIGMANDLYQQMKDANNVMPYAQPNDIPVEVAATGVDW